MQGRGVASHKGEKPGEDEGPKAGITSSNVKRQRISSY